MEKVEVTGDSAVVRLHAGEVALLLSALNESLEALDDWEFGTRMGFERREVEGFMIALRSIRQEMQRAE